jgi:cytochrome c oxidase assembly protein subunit 15
VLTGLAAQGAIGYTQYFSHLPAGLVWVHVTMSAVLWILVLRLYLSTRERQPPPAAATQAGTAPAAGNSQAPGVTLGAEEGSVDNAKASAGRRRGIVPAQ